MYVVRNRATHGGMRRTSPDRFAATALNQTSGAFDVGQAAIALGARFPGSPGCSSQGIAVLSCRPPESRAKDINARTRVLGGQRRESMISTGQGDSNTRSGRTYITKDTMYRR